MDKIQDMEIVLSNRNAILAWLSHTAASVSFIGAAPRTRAASWGHNVLPFIIVSYF